MWYFKYKKALCVERPTSKEITKIERNVLLDMNNYFDKDAVIFLYSI